MVGSGGVTEPKVSRLMGVHMMQVNCRSVALLQHLLPRDHFLRWRENCRRASFIGVAVVIRAPAVEVDTARLDTVATTLRLVLHELRARELEVADLCRDFLDRSK